MPDVHIEGGGKLQYNYSFLLQNEGYTTPETVLCCCYGPPRGLPATIEYTSVYQRSDKMEKRSKSTRHLGKPMAASRETTAVRNI